MNRLLFIFFGLKFLLMYSNNFINMKSTFFYKIINIINPSDLFLFICNSDHKKELKILFNNIVNENDTIDSLKYINLFKTINYIGILIDNNLKKVTDNKLDKLFKDSSFVSNISIGMYNDDFLQSYSNNRNIFIKIKDETFAKGIIDRTLNYLKNKIILNNSIINFDFDKYPYGDFRDLSYTTLQLDLSYYYGLLSLMCHEN